MLAICECREQLNGWLDCITRWLRVEEQLAVLLADLHGHRDKESAAALGLSVPSFKLLLHGARAHLHEIAAGDHALARKTSTQGEEWANDRGNKHAKRSNGRPPSERAAHRVGVTCRLAAPELLALRHKLLDGLPL